MIFLIVAINISITLLNIYIAIRVRQLRSLVARITNILINYERYFDIVLQAAPVVVYRGQSNIHDARQQYQSFQIQITKIRQLIWLVNWIGRTWRKSFNI